MGIVVQCRVGASRRQGVVGGATKRMECRRSARCPGRDVTYISQNVVHTRHKRRVEHGSRNVCRGAESRPLAFLLFITAHMGFIRTIPACAPVRPDTSSIRGDAWGGRFMNVWSDHRIENKKGFFQTHLRSSTKYPLLGDWGSAATDVGLEKLPPNSDKTLSSASFHEWGAGATERALARSTSRTVI